MLDDRRVGWHTWASTGHDTQGDYGVLLAAAALIHEFLQKRAPVTFVFDGQQAVRVSAKHPLVFGDCGAVYALDKELDIIQTRVVIWKDFCGAFFLPR